MENKERVCSNDNEKLTRLFKTCYTILSFVPLKLETLVFNEEMLGFLEFLSDSLTFNVRKKKKIVQQVYKRDFILRNDEKILSAFPETNV